MNIREKLNKFKKSKITEAELMSLYELTVYEYDKYVSFTRNLLSEGILEGVKASKYNNKNPKMFNKFHINKEKQDYSCIKDDIKKIYYKFSTQYYLKNPEVYLQDKQYIDKLSDFYTFNSDKFKYPAAINERAFQIFGEEKLLSNQNKDSRNINKVLNNLNLTFEDLNIYLCPEPFFYYFKNKQPKNILIIENKDTFYTIKKILIENSSSILGESIDGIIYGEGFKIIDSFIFSNELKIPLTTKYYYWGDIDYAGIDIYQKLKNKYIDYNIELFIIAYEKMLMLSESYQLLKMSNNQRKLKIDNFMSCLDTSYKNKIVHLLLDRCYIPQEIVSYQIIVED